MTVRGSLPVKGEEDLVEKAFELQRVHAANKEATEMRKVTRSWTSATKFEKRGTSISATLCCCFSHYSGPFYIRVHSLNDSSSSLIVTSITYIRRARQVVLGEGRHSRCGLGS